MNCKDIEPLLYLVREGELSPEESATLHNHLATCISCRQEYESIRLIMKDIRSINSTLEPDVKTLLTTGDIMHAIRQHTRPPASLYRFMQGATIKAAAATLLFFIISTFIFQETTFYQSQSALELRLQQAGEPSGKESEITDCLEKLEKRYRVESLTFLPQADRLIINSITDEQLRQYIDQACGSGTGDINTLKKMILQSGYLKNSFYPYN